MRPPWRPSWGARGVFRWGDEATIAARDSRPVRQLWERVELPSPASQPSRLQRDSFPREPGFQAGTLRGGLRAAATTPK